MATSTSPLGRGLTPPAPDDDGGSSVTTGEGRPWWLAALDGVGAGAVAVGGASLLGGAMTFLGMSTGTPSPLTALAGAFIDRTPPWLKDAAIASFGTHDKTALLVGMVLVLVAVSAAAGVLSRRLPTAAYVLLAIGGSLAALAVTGRPLAGPFDVLPTVVGTVAAILVLRRTSADDAAGVDGLTRRRVLVGVGGVAAAWLGSRLDSGVGQATSSRDAVQLPTPATPLATPAPGVARASLDVPGLTPYVVPNADFYRIDTAFVVPHLDTASWQVKVVGEVEQEVTLDWKTLLTKPMMQKLVTLTCVSNEVGGDLVGNAVWTGWPVRELLALAGPKAGADMVLSRSSDGFTAGTPIGALTDERDALLAVAMNGEPLPFEHGFPVRLVVPGLYGYVSATKWLTELKVTRFSADEGYWTPRGWSALGPVKTASRIDVPTVGARVSAGKVAVAGVAWAQHRGIDTVEVQVDGGAWQPARLATEPTIDAWRQWVYTWDATAGQHEIAVRATDGAGGLQPSAPADPAPNGAQGYHTISVQVG
ncbi:MAG: molybdopterin-dependent oxidoreductase [Actinomycetota bacterium]|nr:molybdopterin-dependent oxidoreductase [Actinomycetota bacterium]